MGELLVLPPNAGMGFALKMLLLPVGVFAKSCGALVVPPDVELLERRVNKNQWDVHRCWWQRDVNHCCSTVEVQVELGRLDKQEVHALEVPVELETYPSQELTTKLGWMCSK